MDLWAEQNPNGVNPNVSNTRKVAKATTGEKALWIIFWILGVISVLGWIGLVVWWYKTKNRIQQEQNDINEASSSIQISQTKRFDLLNKMVEQVRSHYKFENQVLDNVTKNRSVKMGSDINENEKAIGQLNQLVNVAFERYPDLKSSSLIMELMSSSSYLENEIAATRRTYNSRANDWNASNNQFMRVIIADKLKLENMPIYAASVEQRQDVRMDALSNF